MRDKLQELMDAFCKTYNLNRVKIPFITVPEKFVKLYNFLFSPRISFLSIITESKRRRALETELSEFKRLGEEALAEAKRRILWKEYINDKKSVGAAEFEKEDLKILEAAIKICDKKVLLDRNLISRRFKLSPEESDKAIEVAQRIGQFHAEGEAIYEFKELRDLFYKFHGKLPLIKGDKDFEKYVHEAIHFVLSHNSIQTPLNEFDEGLCTYLHKRFRGWWHTWLMYRGNIYLEYARYFEHRLERIPDPSIGPFLRERYQQMLKKFEQHLARIAA